MHIADMHLDKRNVHADQRVPQRDARMCQGPGVYDDGIDFVGSRGVDAVDERAFVVGLQVRERDREARALAGRRADDVGEGGAAVDGGLACAEEVEVGAIEYEDGFRHCEGWLGCDRGGAGENRGTQQGKELGGKQEGLEVS